MESEVEVDGTVTATSHRLLSVDLDSATRDALLQQGTYVRACDVCTCFICIYSFFCLFFTHLYSVYLLLHFHSINSLICMLYDSCCLRYSEDRRLHKQQ